MTKATINGEAPATVKDNPACGQETQNPGSKKTSLETCLTVLASNQEQIRFADAKAAFIFGINTLLFGFVAGNVAALKKALTSSVVPPAAWVGLVALILFAICAVVAVAVLIHAVMSRFGKLAPKSRCFFGHVTTSYGKDYGKYIKDINGMTEEDWIAEVATQIVETSHIAVRKHLMVKIAAMSTLIGLAFWVAALVSTSLLSCS